jgi:hypothetical protein
VSDIAIDNLGQIGFGWENDNSYVGSRINSDGTYEQVVSVAREQGMGGGMVRTFVARCANSSASIGGTAQDPDNPDSEEIEGRSWAFVAGPGGVMDVTPAGPQGLPPNQPAGTIFLTNNGIAAGSWGSGLTPGSRAGSFIGTQVWPTIVGGTHEYFQPRRVHGRFSGGGIVAVGRRQSFNGGETPAQDGDAVWKDGVFQEIFGTERPLEGITDASSSGPSPLIAVGPQRVGTMACCAPDVGVLNGPPFFVGTTGAGPLKCLLPEVYRRQFDEIEPKELNDDGDLIFQARVLEGPEPGTWSAHKHFMLQRSHNPLVEDTVVEIAGAEVGEFNKDGVIVSVSGGVGMAYLPVQVSYISRTPQTGNYENLGGVLAEGQPMPEVTVQITSTHLAVNGTLSVGFNVVVRDPLSEITQTNRLDSLAIYVNEQLYETVNNLASQAQGATVPVWQPFRSQVTLSRTISIPTAAPGVVNIRVQTGANAAGNVGWAGVAVTLAKHPTTVRTISANRSISFTLNGVLSKQSINQLTLSVDGQPASPLMETAADSDVFVGSVATATGTQTATLWLESTPPQGELPAGQVRGTLDLSNENTRVIGLWQGSGSTYSIHTRYEWDENDRTKLYVAGTTPLNSSPRDDLQPFVVRLTLPANAAAQMSGAGGWLELKLFGQNVTLLENNSFIPGDPPPSGMKHLYIATNSNPTLFAFVREFAGSLAPQTAFNNEEFRLELITTNDSQVVFDASAAVELQPIPVALSLLSMSQTNSAGGAGNYTDQEVLAWFKFLFGRYGEELLAAYSGTITVEPLDDLLPWHWKRSRVENWMQSDAKAGRQLIIRLDNDQKSPVQAAQALFFAFQDCRSYLARYDFNQEVFDNVLQAAAEGDPAGQDLYAAYHQANLAPIAQALGDCALAAEIGLSVTSGAADVIFTLNDVATHAQAGEWKQAGTTLALGALLTGPVMKVAKRGGKKIVIESLEGTFEISARIQEALVDVTNAANRAEIMDKLRPLIESGELGPDFIEWAYDNTKLLTESRQQLAKVLGSRPKNNVAHHYLSIHPSEKLELKFLQAGLDPNAKEFGVWMDEAFHKTIHNASGNWGPGGAWNFQWIRFFEINANPTELEVRDFLEQLKDAIADSSKPVNEMSWPHRP